MSSKSINVQRMTGSIAASITGVDLSHLDSGTFGHLRTALLEHCVIVIREQDLEPEQHLELGKRFGKLVMSRGTEDVDKPMMIGPLKGYPQILRLQNFGKQQTVTETWHADNVHVSSPTAISILAAKALPPAGGDTMFCNQYLAYEGLSDRMKLLLRGLRLKHTGAKQPAYLGNFTGELPSAIHPVVCTHPDTRRRHLFLGGPPDAATPHFEGMTPTESRGLHQFLFDQSIQPDLIYRHRWQHGDVLIWDNRSNMHYAVHDYGNLPRNMNRVTIEGHVPYESPYDD